MWRLLGAGAFLTAGIGLVAIGMPTSLGRDFPPELIAVGMLIALTVLWQVTKALFHPFGPPETAEQRMVRQRRELEEQGLLEFADFRAQRAFEVAELEDEGLHFFLELEDGAVLYLNGQYLYDYAPDDEPESSQKRLFPCTEFTIARHRLRGYPVDITCRGHVLAPECLAPPFSLDDYEESEAPQDGDVLRRSYDDIKSERLSQRG
jgi:hypothetical protein